MEALDGGAARAGHAVFECAGVFAGFQHHFCRAEHRLRRQLRGELARQTCRHPAIAQRLNDLKSIRRTASAQAGDRVDESFGHFYRQTHRAKHPRRQFCIRRRGAAATRKPRCALAYQRRRIRHHPNHSRLATERSF